MGAGRGAPRASSLHASTASRFQPRNSPPAAARLAGTHSRGARQRAWGLHVRVRRERPAPPRPCWRCCRHVAGRALTSRAGRDCAGAEKGAGDSACCVAVREPEAVRCGHRSSSRPTMSSHLVEQPPPLHNNNNNCEEGESPVPPPAGLNSKRRAGGLPQEMGEEEPRRPAAGGGRREEKAAHWSRSSLCG